VVARGAVTLHCERRPYVLATDGNVQIATRTVVIATGAVYRRLSLPNLERFEGAGVYYSATFIERQLCEGEEVIVVGGGNSAGQAAVYLSQKVRRVHMLVRGSHLSETMSQYLIRRIESNDRITIHYNTELVELIGGERLQRVRWRNNQTGEERVHDIRHVFIMTGAVPNTEWLHGCVAVDEKGFIRTGPDLMADDATRARWTAVREPYLFETSVPGVFAVGDVRASNVKRVASAVGEGSIAVHLVHKVLQE
jgi:thioredoxin reductase (NADPH)